MALWEKGINKTRKPTDRAREAEVKIAEGGRMSKIPQSSFNRGRVVKRGQVYPRLPLNVTG